MLRDHDLPENRAILHRLLGRANVIEPNDAINDGYQFSLFDEPQELLESSRRQPSDPTMVASRSQTCEIGGDIEAGCCTAHGNSTAEAIVDNVVDHGQRRWCRR